MTCSSWSSSSEVKKIGSGQTGDGKVNIDILGMSELKRTGIGDFNSDDIIIYYYGQESLRRNGVAIMVNKRVWNAVLGIQSQKRQKNFCSFPRQATKYHKIHVYAPPVMLKKLKLNGSMKTYKTC